MCKVYLIIESVHSAYHVLYVGNLIEFSQKLYEGGTVLSPISQDGETMAQSSVNCQSHTTSKNPGI